MEENRYCVGKVYDGFMILEEYYDNKKFIRSYKIKCQKCGYEIIRVKNRMEKHRCPCCMNQVTKNGINDIATTNKDILIYLKNKEDGFIYNKGSHKTIETKCPFCEHEQKMEVRKLINGFRCKKCGNNGSYPENLLSNLFMQLGIDFTKQYIKTWSDNRRYDFYIPTLSLICETHGKQHYKGCFKSIGGKTLQEEQENDKYKERLAKENGIKYYIVLDCRKSELEWIKNSILNSKLNEFFDLSNINWNKCIYDFEYKNIEKCLDLYLNKGMSARQISSKLKLVRKNVVEYLRICNDLGMCSYNEDDIENMRKEKASIGIKKAHYKEIICLNDGKIYNSYNSCEKEYGCPHITVSKCCRHLDHFSIGRDGIKRFFLFKEEYSNMTQKEIDEILNFKQKLGNKRVFDMLQNKIYDSKKSYLKENNITDYIFYKCIKDESYNENIKIRYLD